MKTTFKQMIIGAFVGLCLFGGVLQAQKAAQDSVVKLRHVATIGYCRLMFGECPLFAYEMQLARKVSVCISGGLAERWYPGLKFPRTGIGLANLDFRWYPMAFKARALSGPFVALHTGFKSEWVRPKATGQSYIRYGQRFFEAGANIGFQWVIHQTMTFNGQIGLGYYHGKRYYNLDNTNLTQPNATTITGMSAMFSFGAGVAF